MRQAESLVIDQVAAYCMFGAPVYTMIPGNLHGVETNGIGDVRWNKAAFVDFAPDRVRKAVFGARPGRHRTELGEPARA